MKKILSPFRVVLVYTILVLLSILCVQKVNGDELNVSVASYHYVYKPCMDKYRPNAKCEYEEINPGLGYEHQIYRHNPTGGSVRLTTGFYRNSYGKLSLYIGSAYRWHYLSIQGGLVTGYPQYPVVPVITPTISLPITERVNLELLSPLYIGRMQIVGLRVRFLL